MGRRVRSAPLESRTARFKLAIRPDPYFVNLGGGLHLGYRRRASGGSWVARARTDEGVYREERIGLADDFSDSDGVTFFNFGEAQQKAQAWRGVRKVAEVGGVNVGAAYTVADAMREYLADYEVRGKAISQTRHVVNTKILPALGTVRLSKLSTAQVRKWRNDIAAADSMKRGGKPRIKAAEADDVQRKRKASANRALNVLRAALTFAFDHDRVVSDLAWTKVKPFKGVDGAVQKFLPQTDAARLVNAADGDFADLCRGALLTGCRYGELVRLRCGDVNPGAKVVTVREAKGGKARHVFLTNEGARFFASMIAGQPRNGLIFKRADGRGWKKSEQLRPMALACKRARIRPAVSFHILRHTHGSWLALAGTPLQVIARQLGHADIRMTERHYTHLIPNYVADTVGANLPEIGIASSNVREVGSSARNGRTGV